MDMQNKNWDRYWRMQNNPDGIKGWCIETIRQDLIDEVIALIRNIYIKETTR